MKTRLSVLLLAMCLFTGCSDMFEKQLDIYEEGVEDLEDTDNFSELMDEIMNVGKDVACVTAETTEKKREKLKENYGENYELMCDSVKKAHDRFYKYADGLFLGYIYNFVERRTILYNMAADRYCKANCMEELNATREILKRYSALSFVESQRACDPPEKIRKDYEAAKELADNCFNVAKQRITEENNENNKDD